VERGPGRSRNDLDEFKQFHLIDWIWQRFRDRLYLRENIRLCGRERISNSGPVVEPMPTRASSLSSRRLSAGSKAAIDFFTAAHFFRPFWSSDGPVPTPAARQGNRCL
jgi:hypothetical protein